MRDSRNVESLWEPSDLRPEEQVKRASVWSAWVRQHNDSWAEHTREQLDNWWKEADRRARSGIKGRLLSGRDSAAHAAVLELFVSNQLTKAGLHPRSGTLGDLTPDWMFAVDGVPVFVEVTTMNPADEDVGAETRSNTILDTLDFSLLARPDVPEVSLSVTFWQVGRTQPPTRKILERVQTWLAQMTLPEITRGSAEGSWSQPRPTLWWRQAEGEQVCDQWSRSLFDGQQMYQYANDLERGAGWLVSFGVLPQWSLQLGPRSDARPVMMSGPGRAICVPPSKLDAELHVKAKKYGPAVREADGILLVAIGDRSLFGLSGRNGEEVGQILEGTTTAHFAEVDGQLIQTGTSKARDGFWYGSSAGWIDGVWIIDSAGWQTANLNTTGVLENPSSENASTVMELARLLTESRDDQQVVGPDGPAHPPVP